jgi:tetratricopeptide (TPR) repeat protein
MKIPHSLALVAVIAVGTPVIAQAQYDAEKTRPAMQRLYTDLRQLLPLAVSEGAFADPANQARVRDALRALASDAGALDDHTRGFDPGARYLARALSRDIRQALRYFDEGNYPAAEYAVLETSSTCVACHSRLQSQKDSVVARGFLDAREFASLPVLDRARLQTATRQFDAALVSFESAFAAPDIDPMELLRPFIDYLTINVRVKGEPKRAVPVLAKFAARPDVWVQLREDVRQWAQDLEKLTPQDLASDDLALARALLQRGRDEGAYPSDRRGLVEYLAASRILNKIVAVHRDASPELAEAYYLLGAVEAQIGQDFWSSSADFYLEIAIRMAPSTDSGRRAYALLEEQTLLGFTGSGGEHLPDEERARLAELKALVEGKVKQ